jgi:hypothetical protein
MSEGVKEERAQERIKRGGGLHTSDDEGKEGRRPAGRKQLPAWIKCSGITESQRRGHSVLVDNMEREEWVWRVQPSTGVGRRPAMGVFGFSRGRDERERGRRLLGQWDLGMA